MLYEIANHAGLCIGVGQALKAVDDLLKSENRSGLYLWGPIIHNNAVMDTYKARGVIVADNFDDLPRDSTLVFRAHGVSPEVEQKAVELGLRYVDATCSHVKANQRLARKKAGEGFQVVIIGDRDHPEVAGINGWAYNSAITAKSFAELSAEIDRISGAGSDLFTRRPLCVLAQTTFDREVFSAIGASIKERYPDSEVYDTICAATSERQAAARDLAKRRDAMIIVGSAGSSNAKQLYTICAQNCEEAYLVETAEDLPPFEKLRGKRIGVTAGASTPDWIIEEVIEKMEEMKRLDGDIDFAEEMESSLVTLQMGQTVKGRIIRYNSTEVYIDLGYKSDGVIPIEEFISDSEQDPVNNIKIDEIIDVYVVRVNDSEGTVQLSKKRVDEKNNWARIEEAFENAASIKATVTDVTNGGLIVTSSGVRIFVPASQVSDRYVEDLRGYLRKPVELRIIDYNKQKRKFVGSMKVLIIEEKRRAAEQLWNEIDAGKEYDGIVKSLTAFGAFVDIGGVDGLVHISELSWGRIKHPSDVVKVGEQISVRVISLDRDKKKISLGYRREEDNPWYKIEEKYPVGSIVTRKVVRIAPFGAFVELEKGIDALVHISQISDTRIAKPDDVLRVGMEVTAKITELNLETKKISMSIKEVEPIPYIPPIQEGESASAEREEDLPTEHVEEMHTTLGDMLKSAVSTAAEAAAGEAGTVTEEGAGAASGEAEAIAAESAGAVEAVAMEDTVAVEEAGAVETVIEEPAAIDAGADESPAAAAKAMTEEPVATAMAEAVKEESTAADAVMETPVADAADAVAVADTVAEVAIEDSIAAEAKIAESITADIITEKTPAAVTVTEENLSAEFENAASAAIISYDKPATDDESAGDTAVNISSSTVGGEKTDGAEAGCAIMDSTEAGGAETPAAADETDVKTVPADETVTGEIPPAVAAAEADTPVKAAAEATPPAATDAEEASTEDTIL